MASALTSQRQTDIKDASDIDYWVVSTGAISSRPAEYASPFNDTFHPNVYIVTQSTIDRHVTLLSVRRLYTDHWLHAISIACVTDSVFLQIPVQFSPSYR